MYCRQCGYNNDPYSKLCHRCGSVLREAEEHYDASLSAEAEQQSGTLKYARKGDDLSSFLKSPFRQLARVTENHRRRWPILITVISAVIICAVVWLAVLFSNACHETAAVVYGNSTANIAMGGIAASDDYYIFYTCPFGENPGLYRRSVSTGEILKISYHCLSSISVVDRWIYGIDTDGSVIRISYDGLTSQKVIDEVNVAQPVVVGSYIYYIGHGAGLYRADLTTLTKRRLARAELITSTKVSEFAIYDDIIYFIEMTEGDYAALFTVTHTITPPPTKDENGNDIEQEPYTTSELVEPNGAEVVENAGCIRCMTLDGENEHEILGMPVLHLSAGNGYLFFQSEEGIIVSATDIDPNAPSDMDYELPAKRSWMLNLETLKYSTLLETGVADSILLPADDGWVYYITAEGDLERISLSDGERRNVLTYQQSTDSFALAGERLFIMTDAQSLLITMLSDGSERQELCQRLDGLDTASDTDAPLS